MIAKCPTCEARYKVADEKVSPGGTKFKCTKCKGVFTVYRELKQQRAKAPARRTPAMRSCPHCGKPIPRQAIKCRFCREEVGQMGSGFDAQEAYDSEGDGTDPFVPHGGEFDAEDGGGYGGPPPPGAGRSPYSGMTSHYARPVEYAGFWRRAAAYLIDYAILIAAAFIVGMVLGVAGVALDTEGASRGMELLFILIFWLYFAFMESSSKQASLGKMAIGIKVTDMSGEKVSFLRATGRHFGKMVSAVILGIGFIMAGFTEKKQALHDIMASCLVVKS